jgi:hypothetical protein
MASGSVTEPRYIFTVTPGRSGQASLTKLVQSSSLDTVAAFEEPQVRTVFPSVAGDIERLFRRRFVETHEILGRGDVLKAFARDDQATLERYARQRMRWIEGYRRQAPVYFDISKYFIRGLHRPLAAMTRPRLVFLVRDPILNMKSFLNRGKNFFLDNNSPQDAVNAWPMRGPDADAPAAQYLWAWLEGYLRGRRLAREFGLEAPQIIHTHELTDAGRMAEHFHALGLSFDRINVAPATNTNEQQGHSRTVVTADDLAVFERWRRMVPADIWAQLGFLQDYDPAAIHSSERSLS